MRAVYSIFKPAIIRMIANRRFSIAGFADSLLQKDPATAPAKAIVSVPINSGQDILLDKV